MVTNFRYKHFNSYAPFDIIEHEDVLNSYLSTQTEVKSTHTNHAGFAEVPFDSSKIRAEAKQYIIKNKPLIVFVEELAFESVGAKCDMATMDINKKGELWNFWSFIHVPSDFIKKFQTRVLDNKFEENVKKFTTFMEECLTNSLTTKEILDLTHEYDLKYPEIYSGDTWRPLRPAWRFDLEVSMFHSVKQSGIIYPICYNNTFNILNRGTHRSLIFGYTGNDIPIFFQYPILDGSIVDKPIILQTSPNFSSTIYEFRLFYKEKVVEVYNVETGKLVYSYE